MLVNFHIHTLRVLAEFSIDPTKGYLNIGIRMMVISTIDSRLYRGGIAGGVL
jgi:hypothetical protein